MTETRATLPPEPQPLAAVAPVADPFPEAAVVEVPPDRLAQAGVEALARRPAEVGADARRVHRVTQVVAGAVGDERDEPFVWARRVGDHLVEERADGPHPVA